ncbi:MAG: hypothetical protein WAN71_18715 [Mycobacterium sp.]
MSNDHTQPFYQGWPPSARCCRSQGATPLARTELSAAESPICGYGAVPHLS